jgi:hypothetical protein
MAYSKYKNVKNVAKKFGLTVIPSDLFPHNLPTVEPSSWLKETLEISFEQGFDTEKERSERLVSPILTEFRRRNNRGLTVYSGHLLNVDSENDLTGECDYLIALGDKILDFLDTPIFSIVEAKKQDFELGTGQCAAQMIGALKYNETDGKQTPFLYGAATDGVKWRFMRMENQMLAIDRHYYQIDSLPKLLGVLQHIFEDCKEKYS